MNELPDVNEVINEINELISADLVSVDEVIDVNKLIGQGLEATLYGMGGVFAVLILFYFITKLLVAISNRLSRNEGQEQE